MVGGKLGIISEGKAGETAACVCTWDMSITIVAVICSLHLIYSLPLSPSMSAASYSGRRQMDGNVMGYFSQIGDKLRELFLDQVTTFGKQVSQIIQ